MSEIATKLSDALTTKKLNSSDEVISAISTTLQVDPRVTYTTNSSQLKEFEKRTGLRAHGLFDTRTREIHLADHTSFGIDVGTYSTKNLKDQYIAVRNEKSGLFQEIGRGIHTTIHESIHAKDPATDDIASGNADSVTSYQFTYITEGLTEYKTRTIVAALFEGIFEEKIVNKLSYDKEVSAVHALTRLDPSVPNGMWSMTTMKDRVDYLDQSVIPALQSTWQNRTDKEQQGKFTPEERIKIDKFLSTLASSFQGVDLYMHPVFPTIASLIIDGSGQDFEDILTNDEDMAYFYNKE